MGCTQGKSKPQIQQQNELKKVISIFYSFLFRQTSLQSHINHYIKKTNKTYLHVKQMNNFKNNHHLQFLLEIQNKII